ncbi:DUF6624 domain-containing protein [Streptomyces sp. NPDC005065]|uniref:DUF6624 domain-containing protein n=1 Tax=Streptomyces sp. NPDC005065 TaxID=3154461 RepID=UPI0033A12FB9
MTLTSTHSVDHLTSTPAPAGRISEQWPVQIAPEPSRPDIAWDLISRADAADRRWELVTSTASADRACSPYELLESANTQVLRRIVGKHGWPGLSLVGQTGSQAALRLALRANDAHHDHRFVRTLLRSITDAAQRGEATWAQWAHLQDRVSVLDGRPQQYGTQYRHGTPPLESELHPVIDAQRLNMHRLSVGLSPLAMPVSMPAVPHPEACPCPPSS